MAGEALEDPRIPVEKRAELLAGLEAQRLALSAQRARDAADKAADEAAERAALARAADLEREAEEERRRLRRQLVLENMALARAHKVSSASERAWGAAEGVAETASVLEDPFLAEDRAALFAAGDPSRVRKDHFKGFSQEELADMRGFQLAQAAEAARRRAHDQWRAEQEAQEERAALAAAEELEREGEAARREARRQWMLDIQAQKRAERVRRTAETKYRRERFDETADGVLDGFGKSLKCRNER
jgi:hypothetical protein